MCFRDGFYIAKFQGVMSFFFCVKNETNAPPTLSDRHRRPNYPRVLPVLLRHLSTGKVSRQRRAILSTECVVCFASLSSDCAASTTHRLRRSLASTSVGGHEKGVSLIFRRKRARP